MLCGFYFTHSMDDVNKSKVSLFDYYSLINQDNVLVSYKGPVTSTIMSEISRDIREKLATDPKTGRKVFAVFMELAQNILYYSVEKVQFGDHSDSVGIILLSEKEDSFCFECGNVVENAYLEEIIDAIDKINSLDRDELRKLKREQRNRPSGPRSKGAGIGLIHVAITASTPLEVEYFKINEQHSFFALSVKISKGA